MTAITLVTGSVGTRFHLLHFPIRHIIRKIHALDSCHASQQDKIMACDCGFTRDNTLFRFKQALKRKIFYKIWVNWRWKPKVDIKYGR